MKGRTLNVALIALLIITAGVFAASTYSSVSTDTTLGVDPGPAITLGSDYEIKSGAGPDPQGHVNVSTKNHGWANFSSPGVNSSARADSISGGWVNLSVVDVSNGRLNISHKNHSTVGIEGGYTAVDYRDINLSKNDDTIEAVYSANSKATFRIDATGESEGTGIVAVDEDGTPYDSDAVAADGSATLTLPSGTNKVNFKVGPSELTIYNESDADQVVKNVTIRIRFYENGGRDDLVVERTTTNGNVDMTGLPQDQPFVATAQADGWYNRRLYISSLVDQQSIYLLNKSQSAVYNVFELTDRSGSFDPPESRIVIERPLNTSGDLQWETVSGDFFGAANAHKTNLRLNERYRIRVANDEGDSRLIGTYMAQDEINPKEIVIRDIVLRPSEGRQWEAAAYVEDKNESDDNQTVHFTYSDPQANTTKLEYRIYNRSNESDVLVDATITKVGSSHAFSDTVPDGTSWAVNYTVERAGETIGPNRILIGSRGGLGLPLDGAWLQRFMLIAIPVMAALSSERIATYGAIAMVLVAGMLMVFGWYDITPIVWFGALIVAIGGHALAIATDRGQLG